MRNQLEAVKPPDQPTTHPVDTPPAAGREPYRPPRGLSIPAVTIVDEQGRVLEDQQRRVLKHIVQAGCGGDIIFGAGTTGECNRLANFERQRLIRIVASETAAINGALAARGQPPVEGWVGVTGATRSETLANIGCALDARAHAAVIAPLSISDLGDLIPFFQREICELFDRAGRSIPLFLYDNADLASDPRQLHLHTRDVKRLSRLPFVMGIKVSASRRVLGNYTKGASHFKDKGEFGIYVGNAMLMFRVFKLEEGVIGLVREYWNRYLLHNELPIGVVSGPANVWPREWQRAWRACYAGDEALMALYETAFQDFDQACVFRSARRRARGANKMISCLKEALRLAGVIESTHVASGTPTLSADESRLFRDHLERTKEALEKANNERWITRV